MRGGVWVVLAVGSFVLALLALIHLLWPASHLNEVFSTLPVLAHGLAFALPAGVLLLMMGAVVMLMSLLGRRERMLKAVTGGIVVSAGVLLILAVTNIAVASAPDVGSAKKGDSFVLVSWNALNHFDGSSAREIFDSLGADVAVLPEIDEEFAGADHPSRLEQALSAGGLDPLDFDIFESPPTGTHIAPLTIIVRKGFGAYTSRAAEQVTFGTLHLVPPAGSGLPDILGIHTAPPVPRWMSAWKADLALSRALMAEVDNYVIVAGDVNATLRHGSLGGITTHVDAASSIPVACRGTWPLAAPRVLRASIDHILVPLTSHSVRDAETVDLPGSDHAAIVATIVIDK